MAHSKPTIYVFHVYGPFRCYLGRVRATSIASAWRKAQDLPALQSGIRVVDVVRAE